jgi:hypothetical protein
MLSPSGNNVGTVGMSLGNGGSASLLPPQGWGPPPSYEQVAVGRSDLSDNSHSAPSHHNHHHPSNYPPPFFRPQRQNQPPRVLRLVTSQSENCFSSSTGGQRSDGLLSPHPFSPTITSLDPAAIFRQQNYIISNHHHVEFHFEWSHFRTGWWSWRGFHFLQYNLNDYSIRDAHVRFVDEWELSHYG